MARILVLGASGLLGINFAMEASSDHGVVGTVHNMHIQDAPYETLVVDLLESDALPALLDKAKPDWLVNCVALADVDQCEKQPELAQALNVELPRRLAIEAAKRDISLLHISTDAVFDGQSGNYREEDVPSPLSEYGRSKLDGEHAVREANPDAIVARVNFFGWGISGKRSLSEFFYNKLSAGEVVLGLTDRYFSPLLVNDLSQLLLQMLEEGLSGLYHVASPVGLSKYDFGREIAQRFSFDQKLLEPVEAQSLNYAAARAQDLRLNTQKIQKALAADLPDVHSGIEGLYALHQQGYADQLKAMAPTQAAFSDKFA